MTHEVIDSHHHLWKVDRGDYAWMSPDLPIARDYLPADLAPLLRQAGVTRTILVQAADTEAETDFLLTLAAETDFVAGVCGWLDLDSPAFPERLAHYLANPWWKSFRPMLQDLAPDDWVLRPRVLANLRHAAEKARRHGVAVLIEPINPFDMPGYVLSGVEQAVSVIAEVGSDNLFLQYDLYHQSRHGGELTGTFLRHQALIRHIQVASNPGRHEPDRGEIDYGFVFAALDTAGYEGWIGCEYRPSGRTEDGLGWLARFADPA